MVGHGFPTYKVYQKKIHDNAQKTKMLYYNDSAVPPTCLKPWKGRQLPRYPAL